jgi:hypothetical protein
VIFWDKTIRAVRKGINGRFIITQEQSFLLAHLTFIISGVCWIFDLPWWKRNKRSSLKIKSLKTTSKYRSAARAVRPSSSTRGLLPLCFLVVFYAFYLRAVRGGVELTFIGIIISEEHSFLLPWCKRNKRSSLKIKSSKTTSKYRSAARAVRLPGSTRGLLPLYFFVVFLCFLFKGGRGVFSYGF